MTQCKNCDKGAAECPRCKGTGVEPLTLLTGGGQCKNCSGSGKVKCGVCKGTGKV